MSLIVTCPNCRAEGSLPAHAPGGEIGCPRCGASFPLVPEPLPTSSVKEHGVWVGPGSMPTVTPPPRPGLAPSLTLEPNPLPVGPDGRPIPITAENAAAHLYWVQEEARRFNTFVARQLDSLSRQRADLAATESQAAAAFATRNMELNRAMADLAARSATLDRREAELEEARAALGKRADEVDRRERAVDRRLEEIESMEQALRKELENLEAESLRQGRAVAEAIQELRERTSTMSDPESLLGQCHCG